MRWKASQGDDAAKESLKQLEAGYIYQETHCTGGNMVVGDESFVVVFSADREPTNIIPKRWTGSSGPKNIGIVNISLDVMDAEKYFPFEEDGKRPWIIQDRNPNISVSQQQMFSCVMPAETWMASNPAVFLTDHTDIEVSSAAHPRIRRIGDDYIVIWMESKYVSSLVNSSRSGSRQGMKALICDEFGNIKKPAQLIQDPDWDTQPLFEIGDLPYVHNDRLIWACAGTDYTEFEGKNIIHSLDLDLNLKSSLME